MDGDNFSTLEAALALIGECDNESYASSSSVGGELDNIIVDTMVPADHLRERNHSRRSYRRRSDEQEVLRLKAKLAVPGRNRSRDLHRLELLELRVEAAKLQKRVDALEEQFRLCRSDVDAWSSNGELCFPEAASDTLYYTWRHMARNEKRRRRSAELENRKLRELLACQLKGSTKMKKILLQQTTMKDKLDHRVFPY